MLVFCSALIISCSINAQVTSPQANGEYLDSVRSACNTRFNNAAYCNCFSELVIKHMPSSLRENVLKDQNKVQLVMNQVMLQHMKSIEASCSIYIKEDSSIPSFDVSPLLTETLMKYRGDLLSPDNVKKIQPLNKDIGWKFRLLPLSENELVGSAFILKEKKEGEYYFDYTNVNSSDGTVGKYKFKDGYLFNFAKNYSPPRYVLSGEESCKFTVGRCEFKSYDGKVSYMYTEYRDGMWIRNVPGFRLSRSLNIDVYDSQGFPVYRFHKSLKSGNSYEEHRVESQ